MNGLPIIAMDPFLKDCILGLAILACIFLKVRSDALARRLAHADSLLRDVNHQEHILPDDAWMSEDLERYRAKHLSGHGTA